MPTYKTWNRKRKSSHRLHALTNHVRMKRVKYLNASRQICLRTQSWSSKAFSTNHLWSQKWLNRKDRFCKTSWKIWMRNRLLPNHNKGRVPRRSSSWWLFCLKFWAVVAKTALLSRSKKLKPYSKNVCQRKFHFLNGQRGFANTSNKDLSFREIVKSYTEVEVWPIDLWFKF